MTLANKITVTRICLIPIFVWSAWSYGLSVLYSNPAEGFHVLATVTFCFAVITDGMDGFVARRWNQRSRLGSILDPIADKGLMFAAMITLSGSGWRPSLPWFFPGTGGSASKLGRQDGYGASNDLHSLGAASHSGRAYLAGNAGKPCHDRFRARLFCSRSSARANPWSRLAGKFHLPRPSVQIPVDFFGCRTTKSSSI